VTHGTLVAGIDLGSTGMKILITDVAGEEIATEQVQTPWRSGPHGTTEMDSQELIIAVRRLIDAGSRRVAELANDQLGAIAISGMGETGMLIDSDGVAVAPAFAWFDPRGAEQATGLPLGAQVTVSKIAYLRDQGLRLQGLRWLNLPEFVAMTLGGRVALEHSLISPLA